jgi:hypothetical protein
MYYVLKATRSFEVVIPASNLPLQNWPRIQTAAGEIAIVNTQPKRKQMEASGSWQCVATVASRKDALAIKAEETKAC